MPLAVTLDRAAEMAGVSVETVRRAIRANRLIAHYPTKRPVVLVDDLRSWIEAAPTEYGT
jgi:hypothetical protein